MDKKLNFGGLLHQGCNKMEGTVSVSRSRKNFRETLSDRLMDSLVNYI